MTPSAVQLVLRVKCQFIVISVLIMNISALAQDPSRITTGLRQAVADHSVPISIEESCKQTSPANSQWQSDLISGRKLATVLEQHVVLIKDPSVANYLNGLEENIVRSSDVQGCFVVKLIKDVEANAYSLPGGFLYVTTGLILLATSEAEVVAALAHETGHVTARHHAKLERQKRIWRYVSFAGPVGDLLGQQLGSIFTFKSSRNAEFEADRLAIQYQSNSGYDPLELVRLLEDEFSQENKSDSFFARLFDEHPPTQMRIDRISQAFRQRLSSQKMYAVDTSEFHDVKSRVAVLMGIANPELRTNKSQPSGDQVKTCQFW